jgi:hypothetical protein
MNQLCGEVLSNETSNLAQPTQLVKTRRCHFVDVFLHAQLRVKQDSEITNDGSRLYDVRSNGHSTVNVGEFCETRPFAEPGKFSLGLVQLKTT